MSDDSDDDQPIILNKLNQQYSPDYSAIAVDDDENELRSGRSLREPKKKRRRPNDFIKVKNRYNAEPDDPLDDSDNSLDSFVASDNSIYESVDSGDQEEIRETNDGERPQQIEESQQSSIAVVQRGSCRKIAALISSDEEEEMSQPTKRRRLDFIISSLSPGPPADTEGVQPDSSPLRHPVMTSCRNRSESFSNDQDSSSVVLEKRRRSKSSGDDGFESGSRLSTRISAAQDAKKKTAVALFTPYKEIRANPSGSTSKTKALAVEAAEEASEDDSGSDYEGDDEAVESDWEEKSENDVSDGETTWLADFVWDEDELDDAVEFLIFQPQPWPKIGRVFCSIESLSNSSDSGSSGSSNSKDKINIRGKVTLYEPTNEAYSVRRIRLQDETGSIGVSLWREYADNEYVELGAYIALCGLKKKIFRGQLELFTPYPPLKTWIVKCKAPLTSIGPSRPTGARSGRFEILELSREITIYNACTNPSCYFKKVFTETDSYRCAKCMASYKHEETAVAISMRKVVVSEKLAGYSQEPKTSELVTIFTQSVRKLYPDMPKCWHEIAGQPHDQVEQAIINTIQGKLPCVVSGYVNGSNVLDIYSVEDHIADNRSIRF